MSSVPKAPYPTRQRRSAIAQAAQVIRDDAETPEVPTHPPLTEPTPHTTPRPSSKRLGNSRDILFSLPDAEKQRMANTIPHTSGQTGLIHQSKFIRYAIARLCAELETKYNNAERFPPPADPGL